MGSTHIRSHVDVVPDIGLANVEALLATRQALEGMVDLQIVAFPQTGVLVAPGTAELLEEAVALGADVVGGIDPGAIDRDPAAHLDTIFAIADRRGAGIDIHLHETDGLGALAIELIAERTRALGLGGRVVISHAFCLATLQAAERDRLIGLLAEHHIAVLTTAPGDRPFPPIKALRRAGVTVCAGSDGIRDCWSPFGNADMLERAMLLAWRSGFRTDADLELALDVVTQGGARALGLADYGLEPGCRADFVLLAGEILAEAVVRRGPERCVVKAGRVVARDGACLV
jgi:cytosine/adenosine deaminase-related metal-dependent hydrolase